MYADYARVLLEQFGDRVKWWTTFNEPWHVCEQAYGQDYMAPSYNFPGIPSYLCGHNLLKAHAKVYHMYKNKFNHQNGRFQGESIKARLKIHSITQSKLTIKLKSRPTYATNQNLVSQFMFQLIFDDVLN